MEVLSSSRQSPDGSFPVPLKLIDTEEQGDHDFPRLIDLPYEAEDSSKFLIKFNGPQGTSFLEVSGTDTIAKVKEQAIHNGKSRELAKVEFSGKVLEDDKTLLECGIVSGRDVSVVWPKEAKEVEVEGEDNEEKSSIDMEFNIGTDVKTFTIVDNAKVQKVTTGKTEVQKAKAPVGVKSPQGLEVKRGFDDKKITVANDTRLQRVNALESDRAQQDLEDKRDIDDTEELVPRGADITFEAEKRGLMNKARAQILFQWDGFTSDRQLLGIPLHPQDFVMIGRVVNQDWYEGYLPSDLNKYGLIPRNYVKIESVYDPAFGQTLGIASQGLVLPVSMPNSPQLPGRRPGFWNIVDRVGASFFSRKFPKQTQKTTAPGYAMTSTPAPVVPPSPFPPKLPVPSMDLLEHGNRLRLNFRLEPHNPNDYPSITAILSLVSAPRTRISHVTVELQFEHDVIIELEPKMEETGGTEVCHSNSVTNDISLKGGATQGQVGVNLKVGRAVSKAVEFSRRTRGTIVGDGEGSSTAYWVLKEDPGQAGRFGLDSQQKLWVKLHTRPVRVDYQVNATIVTDDRGKRGGWFSTKRLSSGRQRFYFRS